MARALKPALTNDIANDPIGLLYRHAFVSLFNHLGRTEELVRQGAVMIEDLPELRWVAEQLKCWNYALESERKNFFMAAIEEWYPDRKAKAMIGRLTADRK